MADNSAGSMISSATGIVLSFLHAKVGREVKSAYGPMWPTRPELIPVSVA